MKVICISLPKNMITPDGSGNSIIKVGKSYNVIDEFENWAGIKYYELQEHRGYSYATHLFIPCSDIDETERIDEVMESIFQPIQKDQK